jgi:hypothetical protein
MLALSDSGKSPGAQGAGTDLDTAVQAHTYGYEDLHIVI